VLLPRRLLVFFVAAAVALAILVAAPARAGSAPDLTPFKGLGAWVDAFDYAPAFQANGGPVTVTPDSVDDMAALGVRTLYLQAAMNDGERSPGMITDPQLVGDFLVRAHRKGMDVVAWYYPTLDDHDADVAHLEALADFRVRGQRFDGIALDIEATQSIRDVEARNDRVVKLAEETRDLSGTRPVGAVVYPAVQIEVINQTLWPRFPYKRLAKSVDVWMPMAYWTFRDGDYRDPYVYTAESVTRLRENLDDRRAAVHPVGGIGDLSSAGDYDAFLRAVYDTKSVGWSIYDFNTMASSAWPRMRTGGVPTTTTTTAAPVTTTTRR
jgi:hypothetical protein